ncbi:MAG: hypothetical protein RLZ09_81 [Pseudomonadota bacterium]
MPTISVFYGIMIRMFFNGSSHQETYLGAPWSLF